MVEVPSLAGGCWWRVLDFPSNTVTLEHVVGAGQISNGASKQQVIDRVTSGRIEAIAAGPSKVVGRLGRKAEVSPVLRGEEAWHAGWPERSKKQAAQEALGGV